MEDWIVIDCTGDQPFIVRDEHGEIIVFSAQNEAEAFCIEHSIRRYKLENISDLFDDYGDGEEDEDDEND